MNMKKIFLLMFALVYAGSSQAIFDRDRYDEEGNYEGRRRGLVGSIVGDTVGAAENVTDDVVGDDRYDDRYYSDRGYRDNRRLRD